MTVNLELLRGFTVDRSLFPPIGLKRAIEKLGFVQADPIRAPARAQDLTLRHRVEGYRAGDLEKGYARLGIEEDFFVTYGFVTPGLHALMHPRPDIDVPAGAPRAWSAARRRRARLLLEFIRERGEAHPRDVDRKFSHGRVTNFWGGSSNATTQLLDAMHYRGLLRVVRRDKGIRVYAIQEREAPPAGTMESRARLDALVDAAVRLYAPLTAAGLSFLVRRLRFAAPQWKHDLSAGLKRAKERLARAKVDGVEWYWPDREDPARSSVSETVRLLAPFDPVVRDRDRFERLWGWTYRFEAYTPPAKRKLGYYALPLLWRDRVIGWGNLSAKGEALACSFGYVAGAPPRERAFSRELEAELDRTRRFLALNV